MNLNYHIIMYEPVNKVIFHSNIKIRDVAILKLGLIVTSNLNDALAGIKTFSNFAKMIY